MTSYNQSITAVSARHLFTTKTLQIEDTNASAPARSAAMRTGKYILCKGPDGKEEYFRLDPERSTDANPVLIKV